MWTTWLLCPWGFLGDDTGVGCHFLLQGNLSDPRVEPVSPALAGRFFTAERPGSILPALIWRLSETLSGPQVDT